MRQRARSLDVRIRRFMQKKITEFPELKDRTGRRMTPAQRGSVWTDIMGLVKGERVM